MFRGGSPRSTHSRFSPAAARSPTGEYRLGGVDVGPLAWATSSSPTSPALKRSRVAFRRALLRAEVFVGQGDAVLEHPHVDVGRRRFGQQRDDHAAIVFDRGTTSLSAASTARRKRPKKSSSHAVSKPAENRSVAASGRRQGPTRRRCRSTSAARRRRPPRSRATGRPPQRRVRRGQRPHECPPREASGWR